MDIEYLEAIKIILLAAICIFILLIGKEIIEIREQMYINKNCKLIGEKLYCEVK